MSFINFSCFIIFVTSQSWTCLGFHCGTLLWIFYSDGFMQSYLLCNILKSDFFSCLHFWYLNCRGICMVKVVFCWYIRNTIVPTVLWIITSSFPYSWQNHNLTPKYDFHSYMIRSMEEEFQMIVGVRWLIFQSHYFIASCSKLWY